MLERNGESISYSYYSPFKNKQLIEFCICKRKKNQLLPHPNYYCMVNKKHKYYSSTSE